MGIKIKNLAQKCADCPSIRQYADYFICGMPETNLENAQLDISAYKVYPENKPDWCPMDKLNKSFENLTEEQELAVKGMSVLFGAQGAFEDDDKRELVRIVRCKDCIFSEEKKYYSKEHEYKCTLSEFEGCYDYHPESWYCADGKLKQEKK